MANLNLPEVKDRDPNTEVDLDILNDTIEYIRPAVQADGGDIKLSSVENGVVNIEMLGACQGCPMSIATLKSGIERIDKGILRGVNFYSTRVKINASQNSFIYKRLNNISDIINSYSTTHLNWIIYLVVQPNFC